MTIHATAAQPTTEPHPHELAVQGIVLSTDGSPVKGAKVELLRKDIREPLEKLTDARGRFSFILAERGAYLISAEKSGTHSGVITLTAASLKTGEQIQLVLGPPTVSSELPKHSPADAIQFADQPNFTVAGVTDFTAAGGHGSDSSLRTSEALARETATLRPGGDSQPPGPSSESELRLKSALHEAPESFEANHRLGEFYLHEGRNSDALPLLETAYRLDKTNRENEYDLALACKAIGDPAHASKYVQELLTQQENADLHRLAGELDESLNDPLAAVREFQKAVTLDPTEQNFFSWASELLLHRAIWQAQRVFEEGARHYPSSARMLTGLGTALFAGAAYTEAANKLCQASDLNPSDPQPYVFLGKVQMAAPDRLPCVEPRLQRFVQQQPGNATANYLYAMALNKGREHTAEAGPSQQSEAFLKKAISIDPAYADAYLQLGVLCAAREDYDQAIAFYTRAIAADPHLSDAFYRLAVAYDRTGQAAKAKEEFKLHDEIAKREAAEIERQRQEVKQFLIVLAPDATHPPAP